MPRYIGSTQCTRLSLCPAVVEVVQQRLPCGFSVVRQRQRAQHAIFRIKARALGGWKPGPPGGRTGPKQLIVDIHLPALALHIGLDVEGWVACAHLLGHARIGLCNVMRHARPPICNARCYCKLLLLQQLPHSNRGEGSLHYMYTASDAIPTNCMDCF